jgi:signal transduction histidine kinase
MLTLAIEISNPSSAIEGSTSKPGVALARSESGSQTILGVEPVDLSKRSEEDLIPAIDEAAAEGLAGCGDIEWKVEAPSPVTAMADADHVHRIVANLVRNAARAIRDQKDRKCPGKVVARVFRDGDAAVVEIADNGPGVPAMVVGRLFQPFAGSASRGGAGLGLAIARELARGMKGELVMSSNGAGGAAFTLRVPAA